MLILLSLQCQHVYLLLESDFLSLCCEVFTSFVVNKVFKLVQFAANLLTQIRYVIPSVRHLVKFVKIGQVNPLENRQHLVCVLWSLYLVLGHAACPLNSGVL